MKLCDIAHSRAGDKGNISNISVIASAPEHWPLIERIVTAERVKEELSDVFRGQVTRYVLPNLMALNFVAEDALFGGVTRSLSLDSHGKCLSSVLLNMDIRVPIEFRIQRR